jgi:hypothetical protein
MPTSFLIENASELFVAPSPSCPEAFPIKANDNSAKYREARFNEAVGAPDAVGFTLLAGWCLTSNLRIGDHPTATQRTDDAELGECIGL